MFISRTSDWMEKTNYGGAILYLRKDRVKIAEGRREEKIH